MQHDQSTENHTHANHNRRKELLSIMGLIVIVAAIIFLIYWIFVGRFHETTDDAYVGGNIVQLMPQISGTVVAIRGDNTSYVKQGDGLVQLDPTDARLAFVQAETNLANTIRQVQTLYKNANQLSANVNTLVIQYNQAQADFNRRKELLDSHAISQEDFKHSQDAMSTAQSALIAAKNQAASAEILVANTNVYNYPTVVDAENKLRMAYLTLRRTLLVSPVTGYIAERSVQLGQQVQPGTPLLAVIPLNEIWVDANFREVQLENIQQNQPVKLIADIYGSHVVYHGKVVGLSPGTGSVFLLLPPQNATGNWIKIIQRLPVRIILDPIEIAEHPLRIGLSMRVDVDTHQRGGANIAATTYQPNYFTPVYSAQADSRIELIIQKIIAANLVASS